MKKKTFKHRASRLMLSAMSLVGLSLSGCTSQPLTDAEIANLPVRVEIHDSQGLLKGNPLVGETLTAVPVCPHGKCTSKLKYQWYVISAQGEAPISGATDITYIPTANDLNTRFSVRVGPK